MTRWRANRQIKDAVPEPKAQHAPSPEPVPLKQDRLLDLQRSVGNRAVQELLPQSKGEAITPEVREKLEGGFATDIGAVRIHRDQPAAAFVDEMGKTAVTAGRDIYFAEGMYRPETPKGGALIAHEIAHVVQQAGSQEIAVDDSAGNFSDTDSLEHEAERASIDFQAGATPTLSRSNSGRRGFLQHYGDPIPEVANPSVKTMAEFIALVRRIEAANVGLGALEIAEKIRKTKYHSAGWEKLLPSSEKSLPVTAGGGVTAQDVTTLGGEFDVTLPQGGKADPSHIVAGLVANAETQSPGWPISNVVPSDLSRLDFATWAGDVGSAAGEWMTAHPLPKGGTGQQAYMDEYAPESDLMGDVDAVAMTSTTKSAGFVFAPTQPLSDNLQRFYFPTAPREGKNRRFHTFCAVEGFALEKDQKTLSGAACTTIDQRVKAFADFYTRNDPDILIWMATNSRQDDFSVLFDPDAVPKLWIRRASDWRWFAEKFRAFLQQNLSGEGA